MSSETRQKRISQSILDTVDSHGTIPNMVLYSRVEHEFPNIDGREYADALKQLRQLDLLYSFDGGYDRLHEVTREGACMLATES